VTFEAAALGNLQPENSEEVLFFSLFLSISCILFYLMGHDFVSINIFQFMYTCLKEARRLIEF